MSKMAFKISTFEQVKKYELVNKVHSLSLCVFPGHNLQVGTKVRDCTISHLQERTPYPQGDPICSPSV